MTPYLPPTLLREAAAELGARLLVDADTRWGGGLMTFASGLRMPFTFRHLGLVNPMNAIRVADFRDTTRYFLRQLGQTVAEGKVFLLPAGYRYRFGADAAGSSPDVVDAALRYAAGLGWPVLVGTNAAARPLREVAGPEAFVAASEQVMAAQFPLYVERRYAGEHTTTIVLEGEVVAAWPRATLERNLLPLLPPAWSARCVAVAEALGLRFCGVEIVSPDLHDPAASPIVRLDANPDLDALAATGPEQRALVVRLYRRLLASTEALLASTEAGLASAVRQDAPR
jgi:hypothetical protein